MKREKEENELQEFVDSKLAEYNTYSIYQLNDKTLIEEIEIKRRKLISDKAFISHKAKYLIKQKINKAK